MPVKMGEVSVSNDGQYQVEITKTEEGQEKTLIATLNNNVGIFLTKGVVSVGLLKGLETPTITISDADGKAIENIGSAIGMIDLLTGGKDLQKCSLGDIATIVAFLLLSSAQDQRETQGIMRRFNREIASQAIKVSFAMKSEAAAEAKSAAKKQAIGQIISGGVSVLSGLIGIFASIKSFTSLKGANTKISSGNVDAKFTSKAAEAEARNWQSIAQTASALGQGIGQIVSGSFNLSAANNTFKAEMLKIAAEVVQNFLQTVQELASTNQQNIRDTKQYMDGIISFLQQTLRNIEDTIAQLARNI